MKKTICILLLCVLVISGLWADVTPKFSGWKQAETEHFTFVYEAASKEAAEAYARIADEAYASIAEVYALPRDKITVYVIGRTNTVNASTYFAPLSIVMYTTPFVIPDFTYRDDWIKYVFTHELIHAANVDFESKDNVAADLFGEYFRLTDAQKMNGWELEGLTTVLETELSDAGRGRSPYFELQYKAPAMEGCLLSYDEIGLEAEPPHGQIYVYGYLMMKSIADRWGLDALADIERTRAASSSYEASVLGVTGESAEDLWREVKIGITKKYTQERAIPEGKTISPRDSFYYKPAAILDDGTLIALRSGSNTSVVLLNPALESGSIPFDALKGEDATVKETVLFSAPVPDEYSVTADSSGKVYASLAMQRFDHAPGAETEYQVFSWDKENGLVQLTKAGSSYFQPSVSRDGSTLVALEQKGMKMRLVQIDTETGDVTPLLEDADYEFAMPAVSDDGSRVALLRIGGGRGAVAVYDMKKAASGVCDAGVLTVVANGTGTIVDPSYPSWNSDGKLTYCSNERGRLEVFEITANDDGTFSSTPVVADPVGALWAYKTDRGIYYGSYASTGNVIKMKPAEEWGVVPDWNGPSMPGEKISPLAHESDYIGFEPYENGDKWDEYDRRNKEEYVNAVTLGVPVKELQNEKKFFPLPSTYIRLPFFLPVELPDEDTVFGFGALYLGMSQQPMGRIMVTEADAEYFPKIKNFSGNAGIETEINNAVLDLFVSRTLSTSNSKFTERNMLIFGLSVPFYWRSTPVDDFVVSSITTGNGSIIRKDDKAFSVADDASVSYALSTAVGVNLKSDSWNDTVTKGLILNSSAVALINWDNSLNRMFYGAEADFDLLYGDGDLFGGFYLQGRYLDAPESLTIGCSTLKHSGNLVDASMPLNLVARLQAVSNMGGTRLNFYEEGLCSFSKSGAFTFDDVLSTGLEAELELGLDSLAAGVTADYSLSNKKFSFGKFYFTLKMNFIRM